MAEGAVGAGLMWAGALLVAVPLAIGIGVAIAIARRKRRSADGTEEER